MTPTYERDEEGYPVHDEAFATWIDTLEEDVVQGEYGYEPGEFTVYPELWHPLYAEGLTPAAAFRPALDSFGQERDGK